MKRIFLLNAFFLISLWTFAQTEPYTRVENDFFFITNNFKRYLSVRESESFENFIDKFNTDVSSYLEGGFGLTFEELNKVRIMKKFSTAFKSFYSALRYGSNMNTCSMKDTRLVMEYFPEITMNIFKYYEGTLIVYKIKVDQFCVFVARHTDNSAIKTIYYTAKLGRSTRSGNMGLNYKCVRKVIDNVDFDFSQSVFPIIIKQENISRLPDAYSFCPGE